MNHLKVNVLKCIDLINGRDINEKGEAKLYIKYYTYPTINVLYGIKINDSFMHQNENICFPKRYNYEREMSINQSNTIKNILSIGGRLIGGYDDRNK